MPEKKSPSKNVQNRDGESAICRTSLGENLDALRQELADHGVELILLDRPMDREARSLATGGFFSFWKKCQRTFSQLRTGNNQEKPN